MLPSPAPSAIAALAIFLGFAGAWAAPANAAAEAAPIPMQAWVHDPALSSVAISPDGKHIVAIAPPDLDSVPQLTIWNADELGAPPRRIDLVAANRSRWKPAAAFWLNNEQIYVVGQQLLDARLGGRTILTFNVRAFVYNMRRDRLAEPFGSPGTSVESLIGQNSLLDRLPMDENRVLVSQTNREGATDLFEMRLDRNYATRRIFRGAPGTVAFTDMEGNVRGRIRFEDGGRPRTELDLRPVGSSEWQTVSTFFASNREGLNPLGFSDDPDVFFMLDNGGREYNVIREYRISTGELSEPIFAHARFNASGVVLGETSRKFGRILGFGYSGLLPSTYWVDPDREALHSALQDAFPGKHVALGSFSDDEQRAIIMVSASNDPGTYYLYEAGQGLVELGRPRPLIDPARLPETRYVEYQARDGLTIPAFLTVPLRGEAPFPAVVMPHGGPWARDFNTYDTWRQFLADRGYVVLQPQYRGSFGLSQTLWRAGDREWGGKMQDDKDDGAAWMVEQGIVDADRIAMYGFSYGGYAAMAAIVRDNPPYQCAISGAGLSELRTFERVTFENSRFNREFQNPTVAGLSPLERVDNASIPILIFHGNRDQIVPIEQSEKYHAALVRAGKDSRYVEITDYGHGPSLTADKQAQVLELLESYLRDHCGPGGL
jgi:dipeptidyl aminopeptidase/acylaminoacyl peptidase